MRRQLVEVLERRKEMMIAALWANSGFEGQEGASARKSGIEDLERHYDEAIARILEGDTEEELPPELAEDKYGFFAAGTRGVQKLDVPRQDEGAAVKDVVEQQAEYSRYIDQ